MKSDYTARDKGLLTPFEARQVLMEYRRKIGVPLDSVEAQGLSDQPMAPEFGRAPGSCSVCKGAGALRLDLPVGHPEFGRLARCWACDGEWGR